MAITVLFQPAAFCQASDQTSENRPHRFRNLQGFGCKFSVRSGEGRHFSQTVRELGCREVISGRHGLLQLSVASGVQDLVECRLRHLSEALQSDRLFGWWAHTFRRSFPREMVENVSVCSRRSMSARPGNAYRTESINQHTRFSGAIIHFQPALEALVIALLHSGPD